MREHIQSIREALNSLESVALSAEESSKWETYDAFLEMPSLVSEIVAHLQPKLSPYAAAYYWHMFSKTIVEQKTQFGTFSTRGLGSGVIASTRADSVSYGQVSKTLTELEEIGAITKAGEPSRDGTPYRVNLPEEIPACIESIKARAKSLEGTQESIDEHKRLDFYNVKENRLRIFERDSYKCYKCGKQMTRFDATLDHLIPVSKGGDNSYDNLSTCCLSCNSKRRNKDLSEYMPD